MAHKAMVQWNISLIIVSNMSNWCRQPRPKGSDTAGVLDPDASAVIEPACKEGTLLC